MKNLQPIIVSLSITFLVLFFTGSFANSSGNSPKSYSNGSWYFINRGIPIPWSGVSLTKTNVYLPIIKSPFLSLEIGKDNFVKVIDLKIFIPLFIITFTITLWLLKTLIKSDKLPLDSFLLNYLLIITLILNIYVYLETFNRV